ncbi:hypothetical protein ACFSQE_07770 [Vogesella fluminis]|uniref:hypothetical protein n=1 Tax=Vogesella fluminis TaxID=1069161 RepID=UPI00363DC304
MASYHLSAFTPLPWTLSINPLKLASIFQHPATLMEVVVLQRMTQKDYSDFWERESSQFQSDKIYDRLSQIVPAEATLEVGCGAGWSTLSLATSRPVLAVDSNPHLIGLARKRPARPPIHRPLQSP